MNSCYLCGCKARLAGITLHKFPKDAATCALWKNICSLSDADNVSSLRICRNHFSNDDYRNPSLIQAGGKLQLKKEAVPSLNIARPRTVQEPEQEYEEGSCSSLQVEMIDLELENGASSCDPQPSTSADSETAVVEHEALVDSAEMERTPKRRKFLEPRYIGEIKSPDVATPRRAKRALFVAKETTRKQKAHIRALQEKNRRLIKKIKNFEQLVLHLKTKNLITAEAANTLLDIMPVRLVNEETSCKTG